MQKGLSLLPLTMAALLLAGCSSFSLGSGDPGSGQDGNSTDVPGGSGGPSTAPGTGPSGTPDPTLSPSDGTPAPDETPSPSSDETPSPSSESPSPSSPSPGDPGFVTTPPALTVGDRWVRLARAENYESTTTTEVKAIEDHAGHPSYRVEGSAFTVTPGVTMTTDSKAWTRVSDWAMVETDYRYHIHTDYHDFDSNATLAFDGPCFEVKWIPASGETWQVTCTFNRTKDGRQETVTSTATYAVEAFEPVTVPAGTFDSFRIRVERDGQVTLQYFAEAACGLVKSVSLGSDGTPRLTTELQSYSC